MTDTPAGMDPLEYDRMAAVEDALWWYAGMRAITAGALQRHLPQRTGLQVLDAGCGTGAYLVALGGLGPVTGIDITRRALDHAVRRACASGLAQANTLALPFADARFDLVTSFDVLVMLPRAQAPALLRELARVARPGGHVLVRTASANWLRGRHDAAWATQHRYAAGELVALGVAAGLDLVWRTHANTLLFPLAVLKRITERFARHGTASDTALPAPWLNRALGRVMGLETQLLRRVTLPFGLSAIALWRRPVG